MGSEQVGRIDTFVQAEPPPPMRLTVSFTASATAPVIDRVRPVMKQVAVAQSGEWPSDDQWQRQLPCWFTQSFKGHTMDEMLANPNLWDFGSWLDAMKWPGWEWWSSGSCGTWGVVECKAHAMPFSIEPLFYLLRTAGAENISLEEV